MEGVNVLALVDTGSVKSFINDKILAILDFNNVKTTKVDPGRYVSITGDPLNIKCKINCSVKFRSIKSPKRKPFYEGDFLVSSNIHHECVLGWDFIVANGLTLGAEEHSGHYSYFVQGPHGSSPIFSQPSTPGSHLSGVVRGTDDVEQSSNTSNVLLQSKVRGEVAVTLTETTVIPPHSEIIVEGRVARSAESQLGMISPLTGQQRDNLGVHVAYVVAQASSRTVPVRIANTSEDEIELVSGRKLAEFSVLTEAPACNNGATAQNYPDFQAVPV